MSETNRYMAKKNRHSSLINIDDYVESFVEERETFLPAEHAENSESRRAVIQAISNLPPRQRQIVILHYFDSLSVKDISEATGLAQSSVSTHLARARESIKIELEKDSTVASTDKNGLVPMGIVLFEAIKEDAAGFSATNADWISNVLLSSQDAITAGAATAATAATAGTTTAGTSTSAASVGTAAAKVATATSMSAKTVIVALASMVAVCAVGAGVWYSGVFGRPASSMVQPAKVEGVIVFSGGENVGDNFAYVNPTDAQPQIESSGGVVTALHWWIVRPGSEDILFEGYGDSVGETLRYLIAGGERAEYVLYFSLECESGADIRICNNFYMRP